MVLISLGYALSFGFFPLRRTRQKSNATSQQRQGLVLREMLQEAQSEFLTVVFDPLLATIDRATLAQFFAVPVAVFGPGDFSRQKFIPELLARPEICHPDIVVGHVNGQVGRWKAGAGPNRPPLMRLNLCLRSPERLDILVPLTTTYETIPYLLHYSPSRRWLLDVVMRQQEGIDDDDQFEQLGDSVDH